MTVYSLSSLIMKHDALTGYLSLISFVLLAANFYFEGIRINQLPTILGILITSLTKDICSIDNFFINSLSLALIASSSYLNIKYGEGDFSRVKLKGPYQVGYKEFRTS